MRLFHDSRDPHYRAPQGALPCGAEVTLRLRASDGAPDVARLRVWTGEERFYPMCPVPGDPSLYDTTLRLPDAPCLFWYDFQAWREGQFHWYGNAEDGLGGVGAPVFGAARSYQITVYDPAFHVPDWTRDAVFYQIFPDRFARGAAEPPPPALPGRALHESWSDAPSLQIDPETSDNVAHDFFGGSLRGILEKLPYLQSLGVTALYLNPIFFAATNHRFDTADWKRIDPMLGTEADFRALCDAARALGIRVVLDGVFSHSGDTCPFFRHARAHADSPYRPWYRFSAWPDAYKSWWGFKTLPELDKAHPALLEYFLEAPDAVAVHWPLSGASGWRIDVADELPMAYLRRLRARVKETDPQAILIGEVWEDASNKVAYGELRGYCLGDTLDGVMNYPLREAALAFLLFRLDASGFKRRMDALYENYPPPFARSLLNLLGSHDRPRALNALAGETGEHLPSADRAVPRLSPARRALAEKRLLLLLRLILAMPGMPCIYYGDEVGMEGACDPFNRAAFPWADAEPALTESFRSALAARKARGALTDGSLSLAAPTPNVIVVTRTAEGRAWVTAVNRREEPVEIRVRGRTESVPGLGYVEVVEERAGESATRAG